VERRREERRGEERRGEERADCMYTDIHKDTILCVYVNICVVLYIKRSRTPLMDIQ
jgi:hypothetical protein